ncbi:hypothetical protein OPQ81_011844 [Rhizoctonia solani]|nr:hypothetical protein OPQ81_011844 [Rhizoctonia solani]
MLVLQDCPVCFEEFDERVRPQTIHCGHVFCSQCLDNLSLSSPRCPICRVVFRGHRIRPVIGAMVDSESEEEKTLWESLRNMTEADSEIRNFFVKENSPDSLKERRMSEYIQITMKVMRRLVGEIGFKTPRVRPLPRVSQLDATHDTRDVSKPPSTHVDEISALSVPDREAANTTDTITNDGQRRCRYESCIPAEFNSKQITKEDHTRFARRNPQRDAHGNLIRYPTVAAAIRSYASEGQNELSLSVGEWLDLFPDTDLGLQREWIWCGKQDGTVGYVPRRCLFVRSIVES